MQGHEALKNKAQLLKEWDAQLKHDNDMLKLDAEPTTRSPEIRIVEVKPRRRYVPYFNIRIPLGYVRKTCATNTNSKQPQQNPARGDSDCDENPYKQTLA